MNTLCVALLLASLTALSLAIEEPSFKRVKSYKGFQVRDYDASVAVETCGRSRYAFMYLAGYIGVNSIPRNSRQEKIAMTAPVINYMNDDDEMCMQFILPQSVYGDDVTSAPAPSYQEVQVVGRPAMTMAVVTFYGWANTNTMTRQLADLQEALQAQMDDEDSDFQWQIAQPVHMEGNQFSGPWVRGMMRKNEVAIRLEPISAPQDE